MPDKLYTFGCTFNVVKSDRLKMNDMDLATLVLRFMKSRLVTSNDELVTFVTDSIHPIMVGPEGGVDYEKE